MDEENICIPPFDRLTMMKVALLIAVTLGTLALVQAQKGNGEGCSKDSQCRSGHCCGVPLFKICRDCCQDGDCGSQVNITFYFVTN
jgi:hypothetical protein